MATYKSQYTGAQIDEAVGKASKALTAPDTTPDSPRIVSIATDGTQQNLTLGDGITVENGVISASGGGGGSGGLKLYLNHTNASASQPPNCTLESMDGSISGTASLVKILTVSTTPDNGFAGVSPNAWFQPLGILPAIYAVISYEVTINDVTYTSTATSAFPISSSYAAQNPPTFEANPYNYNLGGIIGIGGKPFYFNAFNVPLAFYGETTNEEYFSG